MRKIRDPNKRRLALLLCIAVCAPAMLYAASQSNFVLMGIAGVGVCGSILRLLRA